MPELFVYGTLRGGGQPARLHGFRRVQGDMPYPTIEPAENAHVDGELQQIPRPGAKDMVEGYLPHRPAWSFYWRVEVEPDMYVYVGNPAHDAGDWPVDYTRVEVLAAADDAHVVTGLD